MTDIFMAGVADGIEKTAKNRLAKVIDHVSSLSNKPGINRLAVTNKVTGLSSIQKATASTPTIAPMKGRILDVQKTIKERPNMRNAALSLVKEKRL